MVLPAVLRDSARYPEQAPRGDRACRLDHRARFHALARHFARAFGKLPAAIPAVPVLLLCRCDRAWLSRLAGADRRLRDRGAHSHPLLFGFLLVDPPAVRAFRANQAAAELDLGIGSAARHSGRSIGATSRRARKGAARMKRHHRLAFALALAGVLCGAGAAIAQEADAPPRERWSFSGPFG